MHRPMLCAFVDALRTEMFFAPSDARSVCCVCFLRRNRRRMAVPVRNESHRAGGAPSDLHLAAKFASRTAERSSGRPQYKGPGCSSAARALRNCKPAGRLRQSISSSRSVDARRNGVGRLAAERRVLPPQPSVKTNSGKRVSAALILITGVGAFCFGSGQAVSSLEVGLFFRWS